MLKFSTTLAKDKIDSIAIGGFDGIHLAHRYLLSHLDKDGAMVVIEKKFPYALTPGIQRCKYSEHPCIFLDFDEIRNIPAEEFIIFLQREFPNLQKIVIGYDFRFGKERVGDTALLEALYPGEVVVIPEQKIEGMSIHAGVIKQFLKSGEIALANKLLGRAYAIVAKVIPGQGLGKKELYATFNLNATGYFLPKEGVYITQTTIEGKRYPSVTFIGERASTDNQFSVETHILEENEFGYVEVVEVAFLVYIRANQKFDSLDLLKRQIGQDIAIAKEYFEKSPIV